MTRLTSHAFAAFAAIIITVTSLATITTVPETYALTTMPVLA